MHKNILVKHHFDTGCYRTEIKWKNLTFYISTGEHYLKDVANARATIRRAMFLEHFKPNFIQRFFNRNKRACLKSI